LIVFAISIVVYLLQCNYTTNMAFEKQFDELFLKKFHERRGSMETPRHCS
jgi:hypothetical protein